MDTRPQGNRQGTAEEEVKTLLLVLAAAALLVLLRDQEPHPVAAIVIQVCHENEDMVIVMSDGDAHALSDLGAGRDAASAAVIASRIKPMVWSFQHGRLCGVTPL